MTIGALPPERVSPYVRALVAALRALAPDDAHVPLAEAVDHLRALDPALSGDTLGPAEISHQTGMPAFPWMERAQSEQVVATRAGGEEPSDAELQRVSNLDPSLGRRLRERRDVRRHLRAARLLPTVRLQGAVRRLQPVEVSLVYDRLAPDGRWVRVRAELQVGGGGPVSVDDRGRLVVDERVQHVLSRQFSLPLDALVSTLGDLLGATVSRVGRGWVGPFWFPGIDVPPGVPPGLFQGLLLHASTEVVGVDVNGRRHQDPWLPAADDRLPPGWGSYRERRFAASGRVLEPARAWAESKGMRNVVVPVEGAVRRNL